MNTNCCNTLFLLTGNMLFIFSALRPAEALNLMKEYKLTLDLPMTPWRQMPTQDTKSQQRQIFCLLIPQCQVRKRGSRWGSKPEYSPSILAGWEMDPLVIHCALMDRTQRLGVHWVPTPSTLAAEEKRDYRWQRPKDSLFSGNLALPCPGVLNV